MLRKKTTVVRPKPKVFEEKVAMDLQSKIMANKKSLQKYLVLVIALVLVAVVLIKNKNWVIVATVNGQPITRWQLDSKLVAASGSQTLDEMINETLVRQAAAKKGVTVTAADVNTKIADIEKSLAGKITLADALSQQGMTMETFRSQVELQLLFEKLTADQVKITDAEVADYISKNANSLTATDEAGKTAEAKTALESQKRSEIFNSFFTNLKSSAKVTKYL